MKKILSAIMAILFVIAIVVASAYLFTFTVKLLQKENIAEVPKNDTPPIDVTPEELKTVELLAKDYIPSKDIYSNIQTYESEAVKIVVSGEFSTALLHVKGTVSEKGYHFLSVNFGVESGILNALRNSANTLDIDSSLEKGGAFTMDSPIDVSIDLLGQTSMATTQKEFQATSQGIKSVRLWDKIGIPPPTVTRVLVAPFNEKGIYGGVAITSLEFEYSCKKNTACQVNLCSSGKKTTECLLETLNKEVTKDWCIRSKMCDPKQIN